MNNDWGLQCPKCLADTEFKINQRSTTVIKGAECVSLVVEEWDNRDTVTCVECGHRGVVGDFRDDSRDDDDGMPYGTYGNGY